VTVLDEHITNAVYARAGVTIRVGDVVPRDSPDWLGLRTIPSTFERIRGLFGQHPGWVRVEYDFESGFPRSISIYVENAPDSGGGWSYTDFEILVTPNNALEQTRDE
jgi:hypothetical protein